MAQITIIRDGRKVYIGDYVYPSRYTTSERPHRSRNTEWAMGAAKQLRENGEPTARAVTEVRQGESPLESDAAIGSESATSFVDPRPTSWRGITPEKVGAKWFVKWHDGITNQNYSVSGNTPQQCLENLFGNDHPIIQRFIATLPPEDEAQPQAAIPAPTPSLPSPANGRVLRPGSQPDVRTVAMPEHPVQDASRPARELAFEQWERTASVAQLKERVSSDPAFAAWYAGQQQAAVAQPQKGF